MLSSAAALSIPHNDNGFESSEEKSGDQSQTSFTLEFDQHFYPEYLRNNKANKTKSIRCFPQCSEPCHQNNGFCGQQLTANLTCRLPEVFIKNGGVDRLIVVGEFQPVNEEFNGIGQVISEESLNGDSGSNSRYFVANKKILSYSSDSHGTTFELRVVFTAKSWSYGWTGNRYKKNCHAFFISVLAPCDPIYKEENLESFKALYRRHAQFKSPTFKILCLRRNKDKPVGDLSSTSSSVSSSSVSSLSISTSSSSSYSVFNDSLLKQNIKGRPLKTNITNSPSTKMPNKKRQTQSSSVRTQSSGFPSISSYGSQGILPHPTHMEHTTATFSTQQHDTSTDHPSTDYPSTDRPACHCFEHANITASRCVPSMPAFESHSAPIVVSPWNDNECELSEVSEGDGQRRLDALMQQAIVWEKRKRKVGPFPSPYSTQPINMKFERIESIDRIDEVIDSMDNPFEMFPLPCDGSLDEAEGLVLGQGWDDTFRALPAWDRICLLGRTHSLSDPSVQETIPSRAVGVSSTLVGRHPTTISTITNTAYTSTATSQATVTTTKMDIGISRYHTDEALYTTEDEFEGSMRAGKEHGQGQGQLYGEEDKVREVRVVGEVSTNESSATDIISAREIHSYYNDNNNNGYEEKEVEEEVMVLCSLDGLSKMDLSPSPYNSPSRFRPSKRPSCPVASHLLTANSMGSRFNDRC